MALSMSVSGGAVNARHDLDPEYRARLKNVDRSKTKDNLILAGESIEHAYERLFGEATATYIAAKTACDRLVDKYAVNLPDGGDLNDGSTGTAAASPAQRAHVQDRSIERSVGVRER